MSIEPCILKLCHYHALTNHQRQQQQYIFWNHDRTIPQPLSSTKADKWSFWNQASFSSLSLRISTWLSSSHHWQTANMITAILWVFNHLAMLLFTPTMNIDQSLALINVDKPSMLIKTIIFNHRFLSLTVINQYQPILTLINNGYQPQTLINRQIRMININQHITKNQDHDSSIKH